MVDWGLRQVIPSELWYIGSGGARSGNAMVAAGDMALRFCQARPLESSTSGQTGDERRTHYS